jgi:hypothetical protein
MVSKYKILPNKKIHLVMMKYQRYIKPAQTKISYPLSYLCNQSMAVVLPKLTCSKVKPLYKDGEKSCMSNYRPIYISYISMTCPQP